jgi:hypothetical protein
MEIHGRDGTEFMPKVARSSSRVGEFFLFKTKVFPPCGVSKLWVRDEKRTSC